MRTAYIFIIGIVCLHTTSFCQSHGDSSFQKYMRQVQAETSRYHPLNIQHNNKLLPQNRFSAKDLFKRDALAKFIRNNKTADVPGKLPGRKFTEQPQGGNLCKDSSFVRLLSTADSWIFLEKVIPLADGNILIPGALEDATLPHPSWRTTAILLKADDRGNVIWIKQFDNTDPVTFSSFFMTNAFELSNKDIICVATIDTTNGDNDDNTIIYHLDNNGNIKWQNALHTNITASMPGTFDITVVSIAEGFNGDLILCALANTTNSVGKYEMIIRLDKTGKVIWDANFGNDGDYKTGAEGIAVYVQNGNITEVGITHGISYIFTPPAINFLTLDYNTGKLLAKRFFRPSYTDPVELFNNCFTYYFNQCTRLTNGHFIVSGKLFSDFVPNTSTTDHYGVMEFDEGFNLVNSYKISSQVHTDYWDDNLYFNEHGKGLIALYESVNYPEISVYLGSFDKQQFLHERKLNYNGTVPGYGAFAYTKDNGYIFAQYYFDYSNSSSIEFRKMHNSDTSSACLGKDTLVCRFTPFNVIEDPSYAYLDSNKANRVVNVSYNLSQNDTLQPLSKNPCRQTNYCDTVKIHGNPVICGSQSTVLFTAYKNPQCGGIVQWKIDSTGIDSIEVQSDTSALVHFKNISWKGLLRAELPAGTCNITARDTLEVSVTRLQQGISIGPDTVLCAGNTLLLHAGNTFSNYKWQDGSTDSTYKVTAPGKYYVSASDLCTNHFSDTIIVSPAYYTFSIGADTARCNNDTIHLNATTGFTNYQWQPHYFISADTGRSIDVMPLTDTFYTASAQKYPGCIVRDTVKIKVFSSPRIHLGNDTSLCAGNSVTLNAGSGFSSYSWNTGAASQKVIASQKGTYIVKATAANGCASGDTLQILNVEPLPVFSLGADTVLCMNTAYQFSFFISNATFLWNDGTKASSYQVTKPGLYWLAVTQDGCTATDSVIINYKSNPSVYLGSDTTLCAGTSWSLNASYMNATYLWQDGSTLPGYQVTKAGNYSVSVNLNGCIARDAIKINYLDKPFFTLGRDTSICQGETILLQPVINVPSAYLWQDGSANASYLVRDTGRYSLNVGNICGNYSDEIIITPGLCNLTLPNAFTPNGDGINDIFRVKYPFQVKAFKLIVYNRFSEKLFESTDMSKGWNGTYKGEDQPIGSYVWVIQITTNNNIVQMSKGVITLIR